jgi:hypothetical protein
MQTVTEHIRYRLLYLGDLIVRQWSEWSFEFEQFMRNRLIMGSFRYGRLGAKGKPQFDRVSYIQRLVIEYRETGNLECLVDIANLALVEFVEGIHPKRHFKAVDDSDHAEAINADSKT